MAPTTPRSAPSGGRVGRPPQLSREQILAAARTLDLDSLTMRAVAERLGVDRKAINYYVADREGLLHLLAADAYRSELEKIALLPVEDWRETVRAFARAVRTAVLRTGALVRHLRFEPDGVDLETFRLTETCLQTLVDAGFTPPEAGQALFSLTQLSAAMARAELAIERAGGDAQHLETRKVVTGTSPEEFPQLRQLLDMGPVAGGVTAAFEFGLDLWVAGMEAHLTDP